MGTTPVFGIRYPDGTTKAKDLPAALATFGTDIEAALLNAEIPPAQPAPVMVAATAAARDAYWGVPTTTTAQLALQNRGATTERRDTGETERYYALYNQSSNPGGMSAAGWYTVGGAAVGTTRSRPGTTLQTIGSASFTPVTFPNVDGVARGVDYTAASGTFTVRRAGAWMITPAISFQGLGESPANATRRIVQISSPSTNPNPEASANSLASALSLGLAARIVLPLNGTFQVLARADAGQNVTLAATVGAQYLGPA
jgi:hypothetical protein